MDRTASGWINGFIGVVIFSGSLPATRVAVMQFDPVFLTVARAAIAGVLAFCLLFAFKEKRPSRSDIVSLVIAALHRAASPPWANCNCCNHSSVWPSQQHCCMSPLPG